MFIYYLNRKNNIYHEYSFSGRLYFMLNVSKRIRSDNEYYIYFFSQYMQNSGAIKDFL